MSGLIQNRKRNIINRMHVWKNQDSVTMRKKELANSTASRIGTKW